MGTCRLESSHGGTKGGLWPPFGVCFILGLHALAAMWLLLGLIVLTCGREAGDVAWLFAFRLFLANVGLYLIPSTGALCFSIHMLLTGRSEAFDAFRAEVGPCRTGKFMRRSLCASMVTCGLFGGMFAHRLAVFAASVTGGVLGNGQAIMVAWPALIVSMAVSESLAVQAAIAVTVSVTALILVAGLYVLARRTLPFCADYLLYFDASGREA